MNWGRISRAMEHYGQSYISIDVPWIIPWNVIRVTLPPERQSFQTVGGVLVGSSEQSFLHLALMGTIKPGRYVTCSPCFRDEVVDELHKTHFMKVELFDFELQAPGTLTT